MKIELTIKVDYLPKWQAWEGIRELIQNARDAETEFSAPMEVRYRKDTGVLVIENDGCTLPHEALLFGHTTKTARSDLIGKFGEGLKLGVLALVRAGHSVTIRSGSEVWTPSIERSEKFNARVLCFDIAKGRMDKNRVSVEVGNIDEEAWTMMRETGFLFLSKGKAGDRVVTDYGTLLIDEKFAGRLYVKGIFVAKDPKVAMGYDLSGVELDRDRKMIQSWDLGWGMRQIWTHALAKRPDLLDRFFGLLDTSAKDVEDLGESAARGLPQDTLDRVKAKFVERHGDGAVPVATLAESADIEHLGKRGIVTPKPLCSVLQAIMGTTEAVKARLATETVTTYGWHDLTEAEQTALTSAIALVKPVEPVSLTDIEIGDFRDPELRGLFHDGKAILARKLLGDRDLTLRVLVHEVAHRAGGDGDKSHVANIERIWAGIVAGLRGLDRV